MPYEKNRLHKASTPEKEAIRLRAIRMNNNKNKQKEIASIMREHKNSTNQWLKTNNEQGKNVYPYAFYKTSRCFSMALNPIIISATVKTDFRW